MEVASPQHLGTSHSFGSSRSLIDMDDDAADLFSLRWTGTTLPVTDFDFGLPESGDDIASSPMLVISASQIIHDGRLLLPCEPTHRSGVQEREDRVRRGLPSAPRSSSPASSPPYHSAQSTPASLSSCSSTRSVIAGNKNAKPPPHLAGSGRRGSSSRASSWKILLRYLRFLVPLYRRVRALRQLSAPRPRVAPASPARPSTSSLEYWCHGNADTAVRDAILYCKKSSGQA